MKALLEEKFKKKEAIDDTQSSEDEYDELSVSNIEEFNQLELKLKDSRPMRKKLVCLVCCFRNLLKFKKYLISTL